MRMPGQNNSNKIESRFLVQSIELEETEPPGILTAASFVVSAFVVLFFLWAGVTNVDQVESTEGQVVPSEAIRAVQHLEGGIIEEMNIREGDFVKQGDILIRLLPTDTQAELDQLKARRANLLLAAERHRAIAQSRPAEFDRQAEGFANLKAEQQALHATQIENNKSQLSVLQSQLDQQLAELTRLTNRLSSLENDITLLTDELKTREKLFDKGLTTRLALLEIQRQHAQAKSEIGETRDSVSRAEKAVAEAHGRIEEFQKGLSTTALEEVSRLIGELAEVDETLKRAVGRAQRLEVVSPVDGMVQGMSVKAVNAVIQPGQTLMEIVPLGTDIVIEAKVPPTIIGHVKVDQEVDVRVASFDFATFGSVTGSVKRISASTFTEENGDRYYSAIIRLEKTFVGNDPDANIIIPGMSVQANIKTGSKTILDYLLKPVYRGFAQSFGER